MAASPYIDRLAATMRDGQRRRPDIAAMRPHADPAAERLRELFPDVDPTLIGAIVLGLGGCLGATALVDETKFAVPTCPHAEAYINLVGVIGAALYSEAGTL